MKQSGCQFGRQGSDYKLLMLRIDWQIYDHHFNNNWTKKITSILQSCQPSQKITVIKTIIVWSFELYNCYFGVVKPGWVTEADIWHVAPTEGHPEDGQGPNWGPGCGGADGWGPEGGADEVRCGRRAHRGWVQTRKQRCLISTDWRNVFNVLISSYTSHRIWEQANGAN